MASVTAADRVRERCSYQGVAQQGAVPHLDGIKLAPAYRPYYRHVWHSAVQRDLRLKPARCSMVSGAMVDEEDDAAEVGSGLGSGSAAAGEGRQLSRAGWLRDRHCTLGRDLER